MAGAERISAVRAFNRFYTNRIGALRSGLLHTRHPLAQARIIYELGQTEVIDVSELRHILDIDAGQLSRVLARLDAEGLVARERSSEDGRRQRVRLTENGRAEYARLDRRSRTEIGAMLDGLGEERQRRLVAAMSAVRDVLEDSRPAPAFVIRPPRPGDYGWIVQRHGVLYADEYGWDETFEALVARIVAEFVEHRDPRRDAAWIAEVDGEPVGCVLCVRRDERTAQLRTLLVEPSARGMGIGGRLVEECLRFARQAGYEEVVLWTNSVLDAARRIYERAGFVLVHEAPHRAFGRDLVEQTWSRRL